MKVSIKQIDERTWGVQTEIGIVIVASESEAQKLARQIPITWEAAEPPFEQQ